MRLMIEVFPAPVAPTIATLSAAEILKVTSRRTQSPSLYAKLTLSNVISPRTCASSRGCGGAAIVGSVSLRREKRPLEGIAGRMMLYFSGRARVGGKKRAPRVQKAQRGPARKSPAGVQE